MTDRNPYEEPENSTVDNWLGQEVDADQQLADEVLEEAKGDEARAEKLFDQRSAGAQPGEGEVKRAGGKGYA